MKIVEFEQGSEEWLAWRKGGIGGSDASVIIDGLSPYGTRRRLFEIKRGTRAEPPTNPGHLYGRRLEPRAREAYMKLTERVVTPICGESEEHPILRRSYDGMSLDMKRAIEIKCPNAKDHAMALSGRVPEKWIPEIMHGHLVNPSIEVTDFVSYRPGCETAIIPVFPDPIYMKRLLQEELAFWEGVVTGDLPIQEEINLLLTRLRAAMIDKLDIQREEEELRKLIIDQLSPTQKRVHQAGVLITRKNIGAGVRYDDLATELGVSQEELNAFRSQGPIDLAKVIEKFGEEALVDCRSPGPVDFHAWAESRNVSAEQLDRHYSDGAVAYQFRLQDVAEEEIPIMGSRFLDEEAVLAQVSEGFNFIA